MPENKTTEVRIRLTDDEQKRIKKTTGQLVDELVVAVAEEAGSSAQTKPTGERQIRP